MNTCESMRNTKHKIHKRSTALERSVKNILLEGFNRFHGANLTLSSDKSIKYLFLGSMGRLGHVPASNFLVFYCLHIYLSSTGFLMTCLW